MPRLTELLARAGVIPERATGDPVVTGICEDTRSLERGQLFVCMPSTSGETHRFLPEAAEKGASAALTHSESGYQSAVSLGLGAVLVSNKALRFS